jgi:hypothetical protein
MENMMDMPDSLTFEILDARKKYLITKYNGDIYRHAYLKREIEALDRIINFTRFVLKNLPGRFIKLLFRIDKDKKDKYEKSETEGDKKHEIKYFYEKYINKDFKLDVSFIQTYRNKYIILEPWKYKKDKSEWERTDRCRLSIETLEELQKKWRIIYKETEEIKE